MGDRGESCDRSVTLFFTHAIACFTLLSVQFGFFGGFAMTAAVGVDVAGGDVLPR